MVRAVQPKAGDDVLYYPLPHSHLRAFDRSSLLTGKVVYPVNEDLVNLVVWDQEGNSHPMHGIVLWQPGVKTDQLKPVDDYCVFAHPNRNVAVQGAQSMQAMQAAQAGLTPLGPNAKAMQEAQFKREPAVHGTTTVGAGVVARVTEQANPDITHVKRAGIDDVD